MGKTKFDVLYTVCVCSGLQYRYEVQLYSMLQWDSCLPLLPASTYNCIVRTYDCYYFWTSAALYMRFALDL